MLNKVLLNLEIAKFTLVAMQEIFKNCTVAKKKVGFL